MVRAPQLREIEDAFIAGSARPVDHIELSPGWAFLTLLQAALEAACRPTIIFWDSFLESDDALQAARRGQLAQTQHGFVALRTPMEESATLSRAMQTLVEAFLDAGEALRLPQVG